jgi:hypothetical protein
MTLREQHRPTEFEYRVLRIIFRLKKNDAIEGGRKLPNEELHNLYFSGSTIGMVKSRSMRWACSTHGEKRNAYRILLGKPGGKEPLRRLTRIWAMNHREIGLGGMNCSHVAQDRDQRRALLNTVMNLRVP